MKRVLVRNDICEHGEKNTAFVLYCLARVESSPGSYRGSNVDSREALDFSSRFHHLSNDDDEMAIFACKSEV